MSIGERFGMTAIVLGIIAFGLLLYANEMSNERRAWFWCSVTAVLTVLCGLTAIWIGAFV